MLSGPKVAHDQLSDTVSDEEKTNDRRGTKREGPKKFSLDKYETIKAEYIETTGEINICKKLANLRDSK